MSRLVRLLATLLALALLSFPALAQTSGEEPPDNTEEIDEARKEREVLQQDRIVASQQLGIAKIASGELAATLAAIEIEIAQKSSLLETTRIQLGSTLAEAAEATKDLIETQDRQIKLQAQVTDLAVAGFLASSAREGLIFDVGDVNEAVRQDFMLRESNTAPSDLLEELLAIEEDRAIAKATLDNANAEKLALEETLSTSLAELGERKLEQATLQAEMDLRVAEWEAEVRTINDAVDDITRFLQENDPDHSDPNRPPPDPQDPSVQGFQWPYLGRVGSGYGYRIHPIYRTRRLHTGLDIGGSSGDPIVAAKGGEVIWAERRGGYGNTVIIDHGDGITTLYAHMSAYESKKGNIVARGDVIGYIGSTGTSTANHLHFEVRANGTPVDPMPYLP